eukprot:COSAG02_NODE_5227_length_4525_cov_1.708540_2_plen_513_part_00
MATAGAHEHPDGTNGGGPGTGATTPDDVAGATLQKNVDIEAELRDGTLTAEQAVVLQERQLTAQIVEMRGQMAQMKGQMQEMITGAQLGVAGSAGSAGSPLASAVRGIVARLTETPTNFHQATVHFLATDAPEDAVMARRASLLYAGSLAMVGLQSATAVGLLVGTSEPSCATSDQCGAGKFCRSLFSHSTNRCGYCGNEVPLPLETEGACKVESIAFVGEGTVADTACTTRNHAGDPNHVGFNLTRVAEVCTVPYAEHVGLDGFINVITFRNDTVASWCETCVRDDGTVDPLTFDSHVAANHAAMGPFDHVTLAFAALFVAFTVVGELKDIELCSMAIVHAGEKLSKGWRCALGLVLWMRRWVFMPSLVANVPALVHFKGGDALSVCLNTVAILFLCDIDNIAFGLALGERVRARVEAARGVELNDGEASALARTKAVHVVLIVLAVLALGNDLIVPLAFLLGGVVETLLLGGAVEKCKRVGKVLGAWLLGGVVVMVMAEIVGNYATHLGI